MKKAPPEGGANHVRIKCFSMRHGFGHAIFVFRTFRGKFCEYHFYVEAWFRIVASDAAYVL